MPLQTASVPNNAASLASSFDDDPISTPGLTDASADSDTEIEPSDREIGQESRNAYQQHRKSISSMPIENETSQVPITRHDLDNKYFHHDLLVFKNFDLFRSVSSYTRYSQFRSMLKDPSLPVIATWHSLCWLSTQFWLQCYRL